MGYNIFCLKTLYFATLLGVFSRIYWPCFRAVLKRILFRANIRRNSSAEYSAETDVEKFEHIRNNTNIPFF